MSPTKRRLSEMDEETSRKRPKLSVSPTPHELRGIHPETPSSRSPSQRAEESDTRSLSNIGEDGADKAKPTFASLEPKSVITTSNSEDVPETCPPLSLPHEDIAGPAVIGEYTDEAAASNHSGAAPLIDESNTSSMPVPQRPSLSRKRKATEDLSRPIKAVAIISAVLGTKQSSSRAAVNDNDQKVAANGASNPVQGSSTQHANLSSITNWSSDVPPEIIEEARNYRPKQQTRLEIEQNKRNSEIRESAREEDRREELRRKRKTEAQVMAERDQDPEWKQKSMVTGKQIQMRDEFFAKSGLFKNMWQTPKASLPSQGSSQESGPDSNPFDSPNSKLPVTAKVYQPGDREFGQYTVGVTFECDPCPERFRHATLEERGAMEWKAEYQGDKKITTEGVQSKRAFKESGLHLKSADTLFKRDSAAAKFHAWRGSPRFRQFFADWSPQDASKARKAPLKVTLVEHEPIGPANEGEVWADKLEAAVNHTLSTFNPRSHFTLRIELNFNDQHAAAGKYMRWHERIEKLLRKYPSHFTVELENDPDISLDEVKKHFPEWFEHNKNFIEGNLSACMKFVDLLNYVKTHGVCPPLPPPPPPPSKPTKVPSQRNQ